MNKFIFAFLILSSFNFRALAYNDHMHNHHIHKHDINHEHIINMKLLPSSELKVGKPTIIKAYLTFADNRPVAYNDLQIVHTKRFHLLVIDSSMEYYDHIHPRPTKKRGEYIFEFTPKNAGNYYFFADITPKKTNLQQVVETRLFLEGETKEASYKENLLYVTKDYIFKLAFKPNRGSTDQIGEVHITNKFGEPIKNLEPIMGAFAHIVGFNEKLQDVVHVHPLGREPEDKDERTSSPILFQINLTRAGYTKLFVQVKIKNKQYNIPFAFTVKNTYD